MMEQDQSVYVYFKLLVIVLHRIVSYLVKFLRDEGSGRQDNGV